MFQDLRVVVAAIIIRWYDSILYQIAGLFSVIFFLYSLNNINGRLEEWMLLIKFGQISLPFRSQISFLVRSDLLHIALS